MGDKIICVVGIKFNVKLFDSGFDIVVVEGIVVIEEVMLRNVVNFEVKFEFVLFEVGVMVIFNYNNVLIVK